MNFADTSKAIQDILEVFDSLGIDYRIGGSVASSTLGNFRATNDVDIVADLKPQQTRGFISALDGKFYVDDEYIAESIGRNRGFNLIHLQTMIKVDIFPIKARSFDRSAFLRKRSARLIEDPPLKANLFTPEDVILSKLEWYEMGGRGSERQWNDILGVLRVQSELDIAYLRHWASDLGLLELLEQAFKLSEM